MTEEGGTRIASEAVQGWSMAMASRTPTSCRRKKLRRWRAKRARISRPSDAPHPARRFAALTHHRLRFATGARQWKRGKELRRSRGQDGPMWSRGEVEPRLRRGEKELRRSRREECSGGPRRSRGSACASRRQTEARGGAEVEQRRSRGDVEPSKAPRRRSVVAERLERVMCLCLACEQHQRVRGCMT